MSQTLKLQQQAVKAAKQQDWQSALEFNQQILEVEPEDVGALNRLGATYLQLKEQKNARQAFEEVIKLDQVNKLAKKHLERLKNNQANKIPHFTQQSFIEEPGRTKNVELYRLAGKDVLEIISVGDECQLEPRSRYISINVDGIYVGSLPEDLSFRLTKLIESGNEYECLIQACDKHHCVVYIKEVARSLKNQHISSFPKNKDAAISTINEVDESMIEDDIPMEIVDTDTDSELSIDDIDPPEE